MTNKKIAVIGAGVMGQGVSYQFAKYGFDVMLIDTDETILNNASKEIKKIYRIDSMISSNPVVNNTHNIQYSTNLAEIGNSYFIIENITENIELKKKLYLEMSLLITADTYIAVNTSCVSIELISSLMPYPEKILGIHFMNPVHLKNTVEVIKGKNSSDSTMESAMNLLKMVNIAGIIVNDSPGFVSNRILMLTINEAILTLQEGVATVENIDNIHKKCFGHKMGPLETADLIGLDTILNSLVVLKELRHDQKYTPASLLVEKVNQNKLGRKTEEGFYKY